jgi:hypothetical protein
MNFIEMKIFNQVKEVDIEISKMLNPYMCTNECPCFKTSATWAQFNAISEEKLNTFGRTKNTLSNSKDIVPFTWSEDSKMSFVSLEECMKYMEANKDNALL